MSDESSKIDRRGFLQAIALAAASAAAAAGSSEPSEAAPPAELQARSGMRQGPYRYVVTEIGTLGGDLSHAFDINNAGTVVGCAETADKLPPKTHAFMWTAGITRDLSPESDYACAHAISDSGTVVGDTVAWVYKSGQRQFLPSLRKDTYGEAYGINRGGQIVGQAAMHAALWSGGSVTDLGVLGGDDDSIALAINSRGQIVGFSGGTMSAINCRAFIHEHGRMTALGTLGGKYSAALAINDLGQVVGWADDEHGVQTPFLYSGGRMQAIRVIDSFHGRAKDINNKGQILISYGFWATYLYDHGITVDLNTAIPKDSGWSLGEAEAINDRGQIVGWGDHNGHTRAFLLTPIPVRQSRSNLAPGS